MRYSFFQPHGATSSKPELPSILHNIRAKNSSFGKPIKKRKKIVKKKRKKTVKKKRKKKKKN
tara:strand:+ start:4430 stop:4615 length:186 start_codon:yes stop_codon:yes gene_type:complete